MAAPMKVLPAEMAAGYDPIAVESEWYQWWETNGMFKPKSDDSTEFTKEKTFTIILPPPNVTGYLHLGHALTGAVQDTIVRYHRMKGYNTLYLPGTDHAGIATQVVVEKRLMKEEGKSRHDVGREEFTKKLWAFKDDHAGFIQKQLRVVGSSLDWSRERFTMDEGCGKAVTEAFVRLNEDGLLYRATRLVNWCCALQSAISDLEVDFVDVEKNAKTKIPGWNGVVEMGTLTHVAYKVVGTDDELVFATTRPETMLGDAALCVHPDDERYKKFHGKTALCPFRDEAIPIICDSTLVDMNFGTGVVKVTPAHDPNDYECGLRHNIKQITVMDLKGNICVPGKYHGMNRFECRKQIVADLESMGQLRGVQPHEYRVGRCSRTNDIVEPLLMPQWFVDCTTMAAKSVDAVRNKDLKLNPDSHSSTWYHFLENVKPWCVSRQLWWGHRIPAYKVTVGGVAPAEDNWIVARSAEEATTKAAEKFKIEDKSTIQLAQDPDVLDTWFSSALWPFSTMGWPEDTPNMERFFPNSLLETGHDILFFWVARMVMMSLHFTGKLPFSEVFLHAMVRDKDGRKMSKSLGNVIDPIDVINGITLDALHEKLLSGNLPEKELTKAKKFQKEAFPDGIPQCGSDALRFGLLAYTQSGKNVNLDINRVVGYRQFCNKLWNVCRFVLYHALGADFIPEMKIEAAARETLPLECRWILSRLEAAIAETSKGMSPGTYDFAGATTAAYRFWLYELCDVFLEAIKPVMQSDDEERKKVTKTVLLHAVEVGMRMLHPMMPFVTEELWHRLPGVAKSQSIMLAPYPEAAGFADAGVEESMKFIMDTVGSLRSVKASYQLTNKVRPDVHVVAAPAISDMLTAQTSIIKTLAVVGEVAVVADASVVPAGCSFVSVNAQIGVHVLLRGLIDITQEVKKAEKKIGVLEKQLATLQQKMAAPTYATKVPESIRAANSEKEANLKSEVEQSKVALEAIKQLA